MILFILKLYFFFVQMGQIFTQNNEDQDPFWMFSFLMPCYKIVCFRNTILLVHIIEIVLQPTYCMFWVFYVGCVVFLWDKELDVSRETFQLGKKKTDSYEVSGQIHSRPVYVTNPVVSTKSPGKNSKRKYLPISRFAANWHTAKNTE